MRNRGKPVTDKEADDSLKALETLNVDVAVEFWNCSVLSETNGAPSAGRKHHPDGLTASERKLVTAVVNNGMRPSSEYPRLAGISPNTFQKIRPVLIEKGMIREHKLQSKTRGRATILLEALPAALELISVDGKSIEEDRARAR